MRSSRPGNDDPRPDGLRQLLRTPDMVVVVLAALIAGSSVAMFRPLIAPYATTLGADAFLASITVAAASAPGLFLAMPAASAAQRVGERWVLVVGGIAMAIGALLVAIIQTLPFLILAMLVIGSGVVVTGVANQGLATAPVLDGRVDTRRITAFGIFISIGNGVGPLIGGVLSDIGGYSSAFWAVAALGVGMVLLGLRTRPLPRPAPGAEDDMEQTNGQQAEEGMFQRATTIVRTPFVPTAIILSVLGTLMRILLLAFLPLHLDQTGWSPSGIGLLLSSAAAVGLLFRLLFPILERRLSPRAMFGGSLWISAVGLAVAALVPWVPLIVVATAAAMAMLSMINPVSLTLLSRLVADSYRRMALSVRITARNGMQLAGPIVFGGVATVAGVQAGIVIVSVFAGIAGSLGARRLAVKSDTPS